MITIKLNGKTKEIKPYRELTLKEYKEVLEAANNKPNYSIFDYIAYQTGYSFDELQLQKLTGITLLSKELGELKVINGDHNTIEDIPLKKYTSYDGKIYDLSHVKMKSKVGYRVLIEQYMQTNPNYIELYTHVLATVLNYEKNKNFDYDNVRLIADGLEKYNAYNVLGNGAFFFFNLMHGGMKGLRFLRMCRNILIRMRG